MIYLKHKKYFLVGCVITLLFSMCTIGPKKITYGKDGCEFCRMTITNKSFAAEIVTTKGKAFKYDAIECMLMDIKNQDKGNIELYLVTDLKTPEKLIDAEKVFFIISDSIQSPMGKNLAAFGTMKKATQFKRENQNGAIFNWGEIQKHFNLQ